MGEALRSRLFSGLVLTLAALALTGCGTGGRPFFGGAGATPDPGQQAVAAAKVRNGGILGRGITGRMDAGAVGKALDAEFQALEFSNPGVPVAWKSGDVRGEVNAAQPYQVGSQNCRAYTHTVFLANAPENARGTACRNADGTWTPLT
jgi:surface antigen